MKVTAHVQSLRVNGFTVRLVDSTPVTVCPCVDCGEPIQPENCLPGWGLLQTCERCNEKFDHYAMPRNSDEHESERKTSC